MMNANTIARRVVFCGGKQTLKYHSLLHCQRLSTTSSTYASTGNKLKLLGVTGVVSTLTLMYGMNSQYALSENKASDQANGDHRVITKDFSFYSGQELDAKHASKVSMFSGTANQELSEEVAEYLGIKLSKCKIGKFADGEINIQITENVRGKDVFVIQPTASSKNGSVNDNIIELLLLTAALRRSSAGRITAVIPYYGYARSDRKLMSRVPIAASDIAIMLETCGADRVIILDAHADQVQGFFSNHVPSDNLSAIKVGAMYFSELDIQQPVVVATSSSSVARAKEFRDVLTFVGNRDKIPDLQNARLAMMITSTDQQEDRMDRLSKRLTSRQAERGGLVRKKTSKGKSDKFEFVGLDLIPGSDVILIDDIIDDATQLIEAAAVLKAKGANKVMLFASHGLFTGDSVEMIKWSNLDKVVVCNTAHTAHDIDTSNKIEFLSIAPIIAEALRRVIEKKSISDVFKLEKLGKVDNE